VCRGLDRYHSINQHNMASHGIIGIIGIERRSLHGSLVFLIVADPDRSVVH